MNQSLFDREKTGKFVPAIATKEYIHQLRLLEEYVKNGGIVLLIPNGTEEIFQGTFRKMIKEWDKSIPVLDFQLEHSEPFQGYGRLLGDYFRKNPLHTTIKYSLKKLGDL